MGRRFFKGRRLAVLAAAAAGVLAMGGCDWTTVTNDGDAGWHRSVGSEGNAADIVVGTPRLLRDAVFRGFGERAPHNGAIHFVVGADSTTDPEWVNTSYGGTPLDRIGAVAYEVAVQHPGTDDTLVPYLVFDVDDPSTPAAQDGRLIFDADEALQSELFPPCLPFCGPLGGPVLGGPIALNVIEPPAPSAPWQPVLADGMNDGGPVAAAWRFDDGEPSALESFTEFVNAHPGWVIAGAGEAGRGIHLTLGNVTTPTCAACGFDGYADALSINLLPPPAAGELNAAAAAPADAPELSWDFEPPDVVTAVSDASRGEWVPSGGDVSFVSGPAGDPDAEGATTQQDAGGSVRLAAGAEGEPAWIGTAALDGTPVAALGSLRYRFFDRTDDPACRLPKLLLGVDTTPEDDNTFADDVVQFDPCDSAFGPFATIAGTPETPAPISDVGVWGEAETVNGAWTALGGDAGPLPWSIGVEGSTDATIAPVDADTPSLRVLLGDTGEDVDYTSAVANVDSLTWGTVNGTSTSTSDFGPQVFTGGGGLPIHRIAIDGPDGSGATGLPDGTATITVHGNSGGGGFVLNPVGGPTGHDGFHTTGAAWDIVPDEGFTFDGADVCLPYDENAVHSAGLNEADVRLVHTRKDGTVEDITTSVDTEKSVVCGHTTSFSPFAVGVLDVARLAGTGRAETAAAISAATFSPGTPVAYVASGDDFADALAGGPAAAKLGGPVLLTVHEGVPAATANELRRLQPARIVVLGGPAAVSDDVVSQLRALTPAAVTRHAGADRYATSAAVSSATFDPGVDVAYVATGASFADALTGGAAAARDGAPVLLSATDALPAPVRAELVRLRPARIVVLGGIGAISKAVATRLAAIAPVMRIAGPDRYATAAAIAETFTTPTRSVFVATGTQFPDALTGVAAVGRTKGAILLTGSTLPQSAATELTRLAPSAVRVLGGSGAVPDGVLTQLRAAMLG